MIISGLIGGLGNQMFQFALGRVISIRNGTSLSVDCQFFDKLYQQKAKVAVRSYELSVFQLTVDEVSYIRKNIFVPFLSLKVKRAFDINKVFNPLFIAENKAFTYQEIPDWKNMYLYGYWQSWKYLIGYEEVLRNDFRFTKPLEGKNLEMYKRMKSLNSVSVHIRLGDYAINEVLEKGFYYKALKIMKNKFPDATYFIFSDEPARASAYIDDLDCEFVKGNEGENSFIDMQLMSSCKHHIISNSSFSWWAAWLNPDPTKNVIAPAKWYLNSDTKDILPTDWLRI